MLLTKMDLLNYQYLDKMNNNIGILCYDGEQNVGGVTVVVKTLERCGTAPSGDDSGRSFLQNLPSLAFSLNTKGLVCSFNNQFVDYKL